MYCARHFPASRELLIEPNGSEDFVSDVLDESDCETTDEASGIDFSEKWATLSLLFAGRFGSEVRHC